MSGSKREVFFQGQILAPKISVCVYVWRQAKSLIDVSLHKSFQKAIYSLHFPRNFSWKFMEISTAFLLNAHISKKNPLVKSEM